MAQARARAIRRRQRQRKNQLRESAHVEKRQAAGAGEAAVSHLGADCRRGEEGDEDGEGAGDHGDEGGVGGARRAERVWAVGEQPKSGRGAQYCSVLTQSRMEWVSDAPYVNASEWPLPEPHTGVRYTLAIGVDDDAREFMSSAGRGRVRSFAPDRCQARSNSSRLKKPRVGRAPVACLERARAQFDHNNNPSKPFRGLRVLSFNRDIYDRGTSPLINRHSSKGCASRSPSSYGASRRQKC